MLVILLILVELECTTFVSFDKSQGEEISIDKIGNFNMIYDFLKEN